DPDCQDEQPDRSAHRPAPSATSPRGEISVQRGRAVKPPPAVRRPVAGADGHAAPEAVHRPQSWKSIPNSMAAGMGWPSRSSAGRYFSALAQSTARRLKGSGPGWMTVTSPGFPSRRAATRMRTPTRPRAPMQLHSVLASQALRSLEGAPVPGPIPEPAPEPIPVPVPVPLPRPVPPASPSSSPTSSTGGASGSGSSGGGGGSSSLGGGTGT